MLRPLAAALSLALALMIVGCGGAGARPVTFGSINKDLLKQMVGACKAKNKTNVDRYVVTINRIEKSAADEKEAFQRIKDLAEKGDWDNAQKYAEACQSASN